MKKKNKNKIIEKQKKRGKSMKNILIIVGSLRKDGFNYNLAKEIQDKIVNEITPQMEENDKYDVRMLDYANLPMFSQDIEFDGNKEVKSLRDNLKWADKIIRLYTFNGGIE